MSLRTFAFATALCLFGSHALRAEETAEQTCVVSVERIWDRAAHSAFTDLIVYRGDLYCTFREGSGHIPGLNGVIRVLRSRNGMEWQSVAVLDEEHRDLRDPKLSITPDNRLMINCGASEYHGNKRLGIESRVAFCDSADGAFSAPQKVVLPESIVTKFDWLWRVTWHDGWAWGAVQQVPSGSKRSLHLVRSRDAVTWETVSEIPLASPSETTLRFLPDGTMLAMIRHGGQNIGYIGASRPPFTDWKLTPSSKSFGGPNLVQLPSGAWLAGSRQRDGEPVTALWGLDVESAKFCDLVTLPSAGDNSYPGFVVDAAHNRLLVSYYSTHEEKTAIYLATLRLDALERLLAQRPSPN
jgi:hypothetical protein